MNEINQRSFAETLLTGLEKSADKEGELNAHTNDVPFCPQWIKRWGSVAKPLFWSQGMYLVLWAELQK